MDFREIKEAMESEGSRLDPYERDLVLEVVANYLGSKYEFSLPDESIRAVEKALGDIFSQSATK